MRSRQNHGASDALAIGFAALPLLVMGWVSYSTGLGAFA
jgi:hypothetical protein